MGPSLTRDHSRAGDPPADASAAMPAAAAGQEPCRRRGSYRARGEERRLRRRGGGRRRCPRRPPPPAAAVGRGPGTLLFSPGCACWLPRPAAVCSESLARALARALALAGAGASRAGRPFLPGAVRPSLLHAVVWSRSSAPTGAHGPFALKRAGWPGKTGRPAGQGPPHRSHRRFSPSRWPLDIWRCCFDCDGRPFLRRGSAAHGEGLARSRVGSGSGSDRAAGAQGNVGIAGLWLCGKLRGGGLSCDDWQSHALRAARIATLETDLFFLWVAWNELIRMSVDVV